MDQAEKKFLASLSALLAKMAMADGVVSLEEISKVSSIWNKLGLNQEQSKYCELSFKIAQKDGLPFQRYVQEFVATRFGVDAREFLYGLMWDVACADGILHKREKTLLEGLPNDLGLPVDSFDIYYTRYVLNGRLAKDEEVETRNRAAREKAEEARKRKAAQEEARRRAEEDARRRRERASKGVSIPRDIDSAYALLGCTLSTTVENLKKAYRAAAMRWHPDRLRAEGVPQELIDKANEKMAAYNAAWDIIKRHRKIA